MNEVITLLSTKHKDWVRMAKSIGSDYPEDLVQEMYLRANQYSSVEKIVQNGRIHTLYIWCIMRNIHNDEHKRKNKIRTFELTQYHHWHEKKLRIQESNTVNAISADLRDVFIPSIIENTDGHYAEQKFNEKIENELKKWHWYDAKLFRIYAENGKSMRDISAETGISLSSINNTIQACKRRIRDALHEDWQDLRNQDYELI